MAVFQTSTIRLSLFFPSFWRGPSLCRATRMWPGMWAILHLSVELQKPQFERIPPQKITITDVQLFLVACVNKNELSKFWRSINKSFSNFFMNHSRGFLTRHCADVQVASSLQSSATTTASSATTCRAMAQRLKDRKLEMSRKGQQPKLYLGNKSVV